MSVIWIDQRVNQPKLCDPDRALGDFCNTTGKLTHNAYHAFILLFTLGCKPNLTQGTYDVKVITV